MGPGYFFDFPLPSDSKEISKGLISGLSTQKEDTSTKGLKPGIFVFNGVVN